MMRKILLLSVIGVFAIVGGAAALPIVPSSDCLQNYFDAQGWGLDVVVDQVTPGGWSLTEGSSATNVTLYRKKNFDLGIAFGLYAMAGDDLVEIFDAGDTPEARTMAVELGKGPAIKVKDGRMLAHPGVKRLLVETAEAIGIPYQLEVLDGGTTDATVIQVSREGVPAGCVSIPCRYVHTPSEMVDYDDVTNAVKLLAAVLEQPITL